jgi:hypothetical protein
MKDPPEELERVFTLPENFNTEENLKKSRKTWIK